MRIRKVLIVCVLLALPLSAKAQVPSADWFDAAREQIRRKLKDIPSISVAVARGDRIIWEEGFGWADKENKIAASPHTAYMLGSTSKPITATAVLTLRERGQIDLDRPINDYLGESKLRARIGKESDATVRRVVQHTAGLPGYYETLYPDEPDKLANLDLVISRYGLLMVRPGERFLYSNLGYAVLGGMIAHVSDKSFADFVAQDVFRPLGMNDSFVPDPDHKGDLGRGRAVRYAADGKRLPDYLTPHPPASDIYASAHDLARFGLFHLKAHLADQKPILNDKAIDEMQQSTVPMGKDAYGLGWHVRTGPKGRRHVLHGGSSAGVDAQLTLIPEEKLCVVALANSTRRFPGAVTEYVTNAILASLLGGQAEDFPILEPSKKPDVVRLPDSLLGEWTGTVDTHHERLPVKIWIQSEGKVDVQLAAQAKTAVTDVRFESSVLTGKMPSDIGTPEAKRRPYGLEWELTHRGDALDGILYAVGRPTARGLRLGYWVQLNRTDKDHR